MPLVFHFAYSSCSSSKTRGGFQGLLARPARAAVYFLTYATCAAMSYTIPRQRQHILPYMAS